LLMQPVTDLYWNMCSFTVRK